MKLKWLAFLVWIGSMVFFFIGQKLAPANYASIPGDRWGGFFGTVVVTGIVAFIVTVIAAIRDKSQPEPKEPIKKKSGNIKIPKNAWLFAGLLLIVIGALYFYQARPLTRAECYRLGSNERMLLCLQEVAKRNPAPQPTLLPENKISELILHGGSMTGTNYYGANPIYTATLENKTEYALYNVTVKFTFYPLGKSCTDLASDTQYVIVAKSILSGDSEAVKTTITTPFDTSGRFTWCSQVVQASLNP